jgi:hypothetical protein
MLSPVLRIRHFAVDLLDLFNQLLGTPYKHNLTTVRKYDAITNTSGVPVGYN